MQAYLEKTIRIITGFDAAVLKAKWTEYALSRGTDKVLFTILFGVEPGELPALQKVIISKQADQKSRFGGIFSWSYMIDVHTAKLCCGE